MWRVFVAALVCLALGIGPVAAESLATRSNFGSAPSTSTIGSGATNAGNAPPTTTPTVPATPDKQDHKTMAVAAIVAVLIVASVVGYTGNCACEHYTDRAGRMCGKRAAHSKPGGWKPICNAADVSPQMIEAFRKTGNPGAALALSVQR